MVTLPSLWGEVLTRFIFLVITSRVLKQKIFVFDKLEIIILLYTIITKRPVKSQYNFKKYNIYFLVSIWSPNLLIIASYSIDSEDQVHGYLGINNNKPNM